MILYSARGTRTSPSYLDIFCGQQTSEIKHALKKSGSDLVIIPNGMTSILQLLDASMNETFKVIKMKI